MGDEESFEFYAYGGNIPDKAEIGATIEINMAVDDLVDVQKTVEVNVQESMTADSTEAYFDEEILVDGGSVGVSSIDMDDLKSTTGTITLIEVRSGLAYIHLVKVGFCLLHMSQLPLHSSATNDI